MFPSKAMWYEFKPINTYYFNAILYSDIAIENVINSI